MFSAGKRRKKQQRGEIRRDLRRASEETYEVPWRAIVVRTAGPSSACLVEHLLDPAAATLEDP